MSLMDISVEVWPCRDVGILNMVMESITLGAILPTVSG